MNFTHKGYGRIYVEHTYQIALVSDIIRQMNDYEHGYLPKDLITTFDKFPEVVYVHKFDDLDLNELTAVCWYKGIRIWAFDSGHNERAHFDLSKYQHIIDRPIVDEKWVYSAQEIFKKIKEIHQSFIVIDGGWRDREELTAKLKAFLTTALDDAEINTADSTSKIYISLTVTFMLNGIEYKYHSTERDKHRFLVETGLDYKELASHEGNTEQKNSIGYTEHTLSHL